MTPLEIKPHAKLDEPLRFGMVLAEISTLFINLPPDRIDSEIENVQHRVCKLLDLDRLALWQVLEGKPGMLKLTHLYQPQGKPMAWIFSIAKNLFLDELRKRNREVVVGETEAFDKINLSYEMHPENRLVLEAALAELAETERSIILLFSVSGLKHREIASLLNLNISTVLSKYHRGLKKLRTFLEEGGKNYEQ